MKNHTYDIRGLDSFAGEPSKGDTHLKDAEKLAERCSSVLLKSNFLFLFCYCNFHILVRETKRSVL